MSESTVSTVLIVSPESEYHASPEFGIFSPNDTTLMNQAMLRSDSLTPKQTLHFRDVSPLPLITLRRGRARIRVNPYSVQHAYITGHSGTPTRSKPSAVRRPSIASLTPAKNATTGRLEENLFTPRFRVRARLTWAPSDAPQATTAGKVSASLPHAHTNRGHSDDHTSGTSVTDAEVDNDALDIDGEDDNNSVSNKGVDNVEDKYNSSSSNVSSDTEGSSSDTEGSSSDNGVEGGSPYTPFVAAPVERVHRSVRSPYLLRRGNRATVAARIQEQVRAAGLPFDAGFLKEANIKKFNPDRKPRTLLDSLFRCTTFLAIGIPLSEFGRIMRACAKCERYTFVESTKGHDCKSAPYDPEARMDSDDIEKVFLVCDTCRRVYMKKYWTMHSCTEAGDDEDAAPNA